MGRPGGHHPHPLPRLQVPVDHPDVRDHAAVRVVHRVEDHRPGRRVRVAGRGRDVLDDAVEQVGDALPGLRTDPHDVRGIAAEDVRQLGRVLVRLGGRQVDLVEHRDDRQVVLEGHVEVGQRLRLDALGGVDEQHGTLAGRQRPGHLVAEVDVTGRVDEVEHVPVPRQPDVLRLDGDAALTLDVHAVQVLGAHVALLDHTGDLEHPVGQRRLAVVDVGDDAEVPDAGRIGGRAGHTGPFGSWGWCPSIVPRRPTDPGGSRLGPLRPGW